MTVIEIHPEVCHRLVLGALRFKAQGHPDSKRQRGRRQASRDRRAARELKFRPVPLCFVDPTVYVTITGRPPRKDVHAVWMPAPSGAWRRHELSA